MKIITYNVNGLRAAVSKGLPEWLEQENPDSFLLGEVWEDGSNKVAYSQRKRQNCNRTSIR